MQTDCMRSEYQIAPAPLLRDLPATEYPVPSDPLSDIWQSTVSEYIERLEESVALRTHDIPRITGYFVNTVSPNDVNFTGKQVFHQPC